ncbi:MAG: tetratricopeptide repeat protein [Candidatus Sumerlaeaceae bacterium]
MEEFNEFELHSPDSLFQEGMDLLESDHFEEALHAFDSVLLQQPYNADALFHRGVALINLSRLEEAVTTLECAIKLAPTEALFHSHCGYALLMGGKPDAALEKFEYALELQPDSYQNKVYKACVLAERRKLGEARALLEEVLEDHPEDLEVIRHYANVLAALGEEHEALEQYSTILRESPNSLEAISRRGAIFLRQGNRPEAIKCLREFVALSPNDVKAWTTLLETLTEMDNGPAVIAAAGDAIESGNDSSEIFMLRGRALLDDRQYDAAITDLRRARTLNERNGEIHFLLARAFAERGRLKHALLSVNRALQVAPKEKRSLLLKARLHHQLAEFEQEGQLLNLLLQESADDFRLVKLKVENLLARHMTAEASASVDAFLGRAPEHRRALLLSAELSERVGDLAASRRRYACLFMQRPISARSYLSFAGFLMRRAEIEPAARLLNEATCEHPQDVALQMLKAVVLQMVERHAECLSHLYEFMRGGMAPPEVHWLLGKSHFALGQHANALEHFQTARQKGAGSLGVSAPIFRCLVSEAYCLHQLGRTAQGIQLLEENWSGQDPFACDYHEVLADLYIQTRAYAKAAAVCTKGIERFSESPLLHYRLARCSAALGRKPATLRHLRTAIDLNPQLVQAAKVDSIFQRYALSLSMNRLVKYAFLRERAEFVGWVLGAVLFGVLAVLLLQQR